MLVLFNSLCFVFLVQRLIVVASSRRRRVVVVGVIGSGRVRRAQQFFTTVEASEINN